MSTVDIKPEYLDQVRQICLDLPAACEKETWGHPTFRVRDKIFASIGFGDGATDFSLDRGGAEGAVPVVAMTMKSTHDEQGGLLARGLPFFRPKYVGKNGWIGIVIGDKTDWVEVEELILDSYCLVAPKKLARKLIQTD